MTNEEKILAMLAEMQTEIKNLKAEIVALRPHVESKAEAEARRKRLGCVHTKESIIMAKRIKPAKTISSLS